MIEITIGDRGELVAQQQMRSPSVYLDHWALRQLSKNESLGTRLTAALRERGGTLAISWANIAEFPRLDAEAARLAEKFIESNIPHLFFLDFNVFDVIERENVILAGGASAAPHADIDLLRLVIGLRPSGVAPVTCRGMLTEISGQRLESTERMKATFVERVTALQSEYFADPKFRALADRAVGGDGRDRATIIILREMVAGILRDREAPVKPNDAMDFFHAIVPLAYCDFVLLDNRWRDLADRLRARTERAGITVPMARVLSGADAVEKLLSAL